MQRANGQKFEVRSAAPSAPRVRHATRGTIPTTYSLLLTPQRKRAFSLVELLVVLGIIVILIGMLLPALARARQLAKYVRWQGFSHNLQSDSDVCLYYNFQNDLGNNIVANMALSSSTLTDPGKMGGQLSYPVSGAYPPAPIGSPQLAQYWAQEGRFRGKPAITFPSGANDILMLPKTMAGVEHLLQSSQQISVAFWIAGAAPQGSPLFWWPTNGHGGDGSVRGIATFVPYSGGSVYWAAGTTNGAYDQVGYTIPQQSTGWQFWVFTKIAGPGGSMQVYENGVQLSPVTNTQGNVPKGVLDESGYPLAELDYIGDGPFSLGNSAATIGAACNIGYWTGELDEFCIWSRALTPVEVQQMYDAGNPG